jgi:hypothetical protein
MKGKAHPACPKGFEATWNKFIILAVLLLNILNLPHYSQNTRMSNNVKIFDIVEYLEKECLKNTSFIVQANKKTFTHNE